MYAFYTVGHWNSYECNTSPMLTYDKWHFLVVSWNGSKIGTFFDGKELCPPEDVTIISLDGEKNLNPLVIGAYGSSLQFPGYIDEVRIYEEGLSLAQIKKLYAEGARKRGLLVKE